MQKTNKNRVCPEVKKQKQDEKNFQEAIRHSLETQNNYENQRFFKNMDELKQCLKRFGISKFWDVVHREESLYFLNLVTHANNVLFVYSVHIDKHLQVTLSFKGEQINQLKPYKFPMPINNINDLLDLLQKIEENEIVSNIEPQVDIALSILNNVTNAVDDNKKSVLEFITEQLNLLFTAPEKYRYSPDTLFFSSMFFLLSPNAYKFVRQSGLLILPHPSTIRRLSAKFNVNPLNEMNDDNFLAYAKQRIKSLEKKQLYVSLMIDEIHLKESFDYKGGNIVGFAHDGVECATSAHVFMLQSLFSKFKDVVYILPVKKSLLMFFFQY